MGRFFGGRASEVFRKFKNDVLPEFWLPMMRMLRNGQWRFRNLGSNGRTCMELGPSFSLPAEGY